ncbi:DUF2591 family protein [Providencia rettgeri]|uniref:phage protein NinX family protein n=1 Tax=Providencia rettgeri TaxID=587 RepID=UPI001B375D61|nr:phage protein NinX family protein [Providencia rettgeri]MBQ0397846.1 DUF2591 family protein [Providencia rettgeri]
MNKYTGLSDFEINKKVAERLFLKFSDCSSVVLFEGESFNPCNNPADAMPIIIENGISMVRVNNTWSAHQFNNHCIEINGDSYYRIAMEVYLLMKDEENSNGN